MNKQVKVNHVLELYERLTYHIENEEHSEEKLLRQELENFKTSSTGTELSLTEVHMIACIGDKTNEMLNGTTIAKALNITKGGVSKAAAKLIAKNMVDVVRSETNRKEVYYTLTALGQNVYKAHEQMHGKAKDQQRAVLANYSEQELEIIAKFLKDML